MVRAWFDGGSSLYRTISLTASFSSALFVTAGGDVYVNNVVVGQVERWAPNGTTGVPVMFVNDDCQGLFLDISNTLYCSLTTWHQVGARSLDDSTNAPRLVAGTGCYGSGPDQLAQPHGIFVDVNLDFYVADSGNNRIQHFGVGQTLGTTRAGSGASGAINLNYPTAVVLDASGYLFIADEHNNRIVGSGPDGFRCVAGCTSTPGSASFELHEPSSMAFDSDGNILVSDTSNTRIQKFIVDNSFVGEWKSVSNCEQE